jgi:hypothetical protein
MGSPSSTFTLKNFFIILGRMKMKILPAAQSIVLLLLSFQLIATAKIQESPLPDRWHTLVLDQSAPEDAINSLGKPRKEYLSPLRADPLSSWLTKRCKQKIFRTFEYKNPVEGVERAWLFFLEGKLVAIMLDMKEGMVTPNGLSGIYGVEFQPVVGTADLALSPRDFERHQGKIYPKTYPTIYHLTAASEHSFVTAMISNVPSFGGAFAKGVGVPDKPGSFPGQVSFIQLISRTLENKDGAEALR